MNCPKCKKRMHFMSAEDVPGEKEKRYAFFICTDCNEIDYKKIDLKNPKEDDYFY